eukprot:1207485-Rhodomonas_salina.1
MDGDAGADVRSVWRGQHPVRARLQGRRPPDQRHRVPGTLLRLPTYLLPSVHNAHCPQSTLTFPTKLRLPLAQPCADPRLCGDADGVGRAGEDARPRHGPAQHGAAEPGEPGPDARVHAAAAAAADPAAAALPRLRHALRHERVPALHAAAHAGSKPVPLFPANQLLSRTTWPHVVFTAEPSTLLRRVLSEALRVRQQQGVMMMGLAFGDASEAPQQSFKEWFDDLAKTDPERQKRIYQ